MDHVRLNNILIDNLHGSRPGFSCQTQLISLIEDVSHALDNQLLTDLITVLLKGNVANARSFFAIYECVSSVTSAF